MTTTAVYRGAKTMVGCTYQEGEFFSSKINVSSFYKASYICFPELHVEQKYCAIKASMIAARHNTYQQHSNRICLIQNRKLGSESYTSRLLHYSQFGRWALGECPLFKTFLFLYGQALGLCFLSRHAPLVATDAHLAILQRNSVPIRLHV